ncbi:hypothetical protein [Antarctobacter sp.]|uniref:hypothetical protein n=1 Tax=Antarctobacter sp. TaxID=1872577 RepID=UPI002B267000|nr:hypothetical protein [Antarctobacter sp.]
MDPTLTLARIPPSYDRDHRPDKREIDAFYQTHGNAALAEARIGWRQMTATFVQLVRPRRRAAGFVALFRKV